MASPTKPLSIFMTGGSGYVGSVVISLAVAHGHSIRSLSRTEETDAKLRSLGAEPVRGDLTSLDVLREESSRADAVVHLATAFVFAQSTYDDIIETDFAALDAIAAGMRASHGGGAGTPKTLVTASGTLFAAADPSGAETDETAPRRPVDPSFGFSRWKTEERALDLARGSNAASSPENPIRVAVLRLAPYVDGRGGSGVARFMHLAAQLGAVTVIDGGKNRMTTVHVDDAASLCLMLVEQSRGEGGEVFNASAQTDVTAAELWGAVAEAVGVPVRDISREDAEAQLGAFVAWFMSQEGRSSGAKAERELGWRPRGPGILEEVSKGSYQEIAKQLRQK